MNRITGFGLHRSGRRQHNAKVLCNAIVLELARIAEMGAIPRVTVKKLKGGWAYYSPLTHQIVVSIAMCERLTELELKTLLAHEVAHAMQRCEILKAGMRGVLLPIVVLFFGLCIGGWASLRATSKPSVVVCLISMVATVLAVWAVEAKVEPEWRRSYRQREAEADTFADRVTGEGSMARTRAACTALEEETSNKDI